MKKPKQTLKDRRILKMLEMMLPEGETESLPELPKKALPGDPEDVDEEDFEIASAVPMV